MPPTEPSQPWSDRRAWMAALALAPLEDLEAAWSASWPKPAWSWLRAPEIGLVMVRGRAGGTGQAFNLGEMTVTRCAVRTEAGIVGHAYIAGRAPRHAELAALIDAVFVGGADEPFRRAILEPMVRHRSARQSEASRKAAATRVEFFTLVRGEDP